MSADELANTRAKAATLACATKLLDGEIFYSLKEAQIMIDLCGSSVGRVR